MAYCWAHARQKLFEVAQTGVTPIAGEGLKQIAALCQNEKSIRGLSPVKRLAIHRDRTKPIIDAFETWLAINRTRVKLTDILDVLPGGFP